MVDAFFIVGPTAVGKTGLAVELAEQVGAEIVSADAFQVYQGFNLLTAKPTPDELRRVKHHLVGTVPVDESYNVAKYLEEATRSLADIRARGKLAFVVGGNGLYIKALTHGLSPLPPADPALRAELETLARVELFSRLRELDPVTCTTINRSNGRRLVRALEVCLLTGKPFSSFRSEWQPPETPPPSNGVFLLRDREDLSMRIADRTGAMLDGGALDEVRAQIQQQPSLTASQILGLRDIQEHLSGKTDLQTCRERITTATRQYAKRQVTWFKRETVFDRLDLTGMDEAEQLFQVKVQFQRWHARAVGVTNALDAEEQTA